VEEWGWGEIWQSEEHEHCNFNLGEEVVLETFLRDSNWLNSHVARQPYIQGVGGRVCTTFSAALSCTAFLASKEALKIDQLSENICSILGSNF